MKVFRRERLPVLVHVLFAASFGVLLYFGVVGGPTYGPALLGVAGAWGGAILTIEYPVVSEAYRRWIQRKAELEAAYSRLLPLADSYARASDCYSDKTAENKNATNDRDAAQKRLDRKYNDENKRALDVADKKLLMTAQSFLAARKISEERCEEYMRARDSVDRLAPGRVRSALTDFDESLTHKTPARDNARLGFVKAVRADLHQRRWPDPHS
jgi:hypothetical protein